MCSTKGPEASESSFCAFLCLAISYLKLGKEHFCLPSPHPKTFVKCQEFHFPSYCSFSTKFFSKRTWTESRLLYVPFVFLFLLIFFVVERQMLIFLHESPVFFQCLSLLSVYLSVLFCDGTKGALPMGHYPCPIKHRNQASSDVPFQSFVTTLVCYKTEWENFTFFTVFDVAQRSGLSLFWWLVI